MAKSDKEAPRSLPPYVPFKTFVNFIDRLKSTVIPPRIDRTVIPSLSGQTQSQLYSGLRFLGLIDGQEVVTERLKRLVASYGTEKWKDELSEVIGEAYVPIIGELDLDTASMGALAEAFRRGGVDGQMLEKAIRFYLSAWDEAGSTYSPLLKARGVRTTMRSSTKRPRMTTATSNTASGIATHTLPEGRFQIPFSIIDLDGYIELSKTVTVEEWGRISEYVKFVVGLQPHNVRARLKAEKENAD